MEEMITEQSTALIAEEIWEAISKEGFDIPIEAPVSGISMRPLMRHKGDYVKIVPLRREVVLGDIIVFRRSDGRLVMHRVFRITEAYIQTIGDNCDKPDERITYDRIYGLVTHLRRGRLKVHMDNGFMRGVGRLLTKTIPVRRPVRRFAFRYIRRPLGQIVKKILKIER